MEVPNKLFQKEIEGKTTQLYKLSNANGMQVWITNYGGRIVRWYAPDQNGEIDDIVLGFNAMDEYLEATEQYYGAIIGRVSNRIAGASFSLNGDNYQLTANERTHHLHGGPGGFHNVVWDTDSYDQQNLTLSYVSRDGEEGYPGTVQVTVEYSLTATNDLKVEYRAKTDSKTLVSLTNHTFFNLNGAARGTVNNHRLMINADSYTPIDESLIPNGTVAPVKGTPFDFTDLKPIRKDLQESHPQLHNASGYDHNFVLNKKGGNKLSHAAKVVAPQSGRVLDILTTKPAIQFYGGNFLDGSDIGKEGVPYSRRSAFCLEPQQFPNAANEPAFPSVVLEPDSTYHSLSVYRLDTL